MQILFISFKEDGKFVCEDNIIFESGKVQLPKPGLIKDTQIDRKVEILYICLE